MQKKIVLFLLLTATVFAQKKPKEVGFISDNDLYTSTVYDKYYTNGLEFFYRYLNANANEKIEKKITEFRFGQYVYNPQTRLADNINRNDRPFAGYLFAEVGRNFFYKSESVLKTNFQLGLVGPNAFAKETQRSFHYVFGYKRVYGWQNQIKNALSLQTNWLYSKKIMSGFFNQTIDFQVQSEANVGTVWNGIAIGIMARIGLKKLLPIYDTNLHGASLNEDVSIYKNQSEFYFYINPNCNYQLYDATIQGSLFNNNSPVTFDLVPFRFQGEAGFKYRKNHWNASYSFLYRSKEVDNRANKSYFYGSIAIGYLLY
jgi:lipid A 3-O-deacylase